MEKGGISGCPMKDEPVMNICRPANNPIKSKSRKFNLNPANATLPWSKLFSKTAAFMAAFGLMYDMQAWHSHNSLILKT